MYDFFSLYGFFKLLSNSCIPQLSLPLLWECMSVLELGRCQGEDRVGCLCPSRCIDGTESLLSHPFDSWPPSLFSPVFFFSPPLLPTAPNQTHGDRGWDPETEKQGKGLKPSLGNQATGCGCVLSVFTWFLNQCETWVRIAGEQRFKLGGNVWEINFGVISERCFTETIHS